MRSLDLVACGLVAPEGHDILGGSWDLVSKVISTLIGVISIVTLLITLVTKSHDPLSRSLNHQWQYSLELLHEMRIQKTSNLP